ncbi:MAG TPA: DNA-3-methyladenine glycosylase [Vicinamibacterales bacterium]|nr:DNA-3-methyladenine glycosylase [Vicinamibacterales bacterium]
MTPDEFARARRALMRRDPVLAAIIRKYPNRSLVDTPPAEPFLALVRAITSQQLSTKAASTILGRVLDLMGGLAVPEALAHVSDDQLRQAGLSRQKAAYLRDLGAKVLSGELSLQALHDMPDDAVIEAITRVKGLGRWSAEMFLMFRMRRPDVLPVDDLGIVNAITRAYGLRKRPKPDRIRRIGEPWRPYRTVACWYLWRSLENTPMTPRPATPASTPPLRRRP